MLRIDNLAHESDTIIVTSGTTITTISRDEDGCVHVVVTSISIKKDSPNMVERHLVLGVMGDLK